MDYLIDVSAGVVASVVFWVLFGLAVYLFAQLSRKRFVKLFGDRSTTPILLSNAWVPGVTTRPIGYLLSLHEMNAGLAITSLFARAPIRLPEIVRGLVDGIWLPNSISCPLEVAEPTEDPAQAERAGFVVGSALRNSVRRELLNQSVPSASFEQEDQRAAADLEDVVIVSKNGQILQTLRTPMRLAVIEKVLMPSTNVPVFLCAGRRADMSACAAQYLAHEWRRIERQFGGEPFVMVLGYPRTPTYREDHSGALILYSSATA